MEQVLQLRRDIKDFTFRCAYALKSYDFVVDYNGVNASFYKVIFECFRDVKYFLVPYFPKAQAHS